MLNPFAVAIFQHRTIHCIGNVFISAKSRIIPQFRRIFHVQCGISCSHNSLQWKARMQRYVGISLTRKLDWVCFAYCAFQRTTAKLIIFFIHNWSQYQVKLQNNFILMNTIQNSALVVVFFSIVYSALQRALSSAISVRESCSCGLW